MVEFGNGHADGRFLQDLLLLGHADQQRGGTQAVNLPWDAFGVVVDAGHRLGQIEGWEMVGSGQTLEKASWAASRWA